MFKTRRIIEHNKVLHVMCKVVPALVILRSHPELCNISLVGFVVDIRVAGRMCVDSDVGNAP
jgi:hypothetical protein